MTCDGSVTTPNRFEDDVSIGGETRTRGAASKVFESHELPLEERAEFGAVRDLVGGILDQQ